MSTTIMRLHKTITFSTGMLLSCLTVLLLAGCANSNASKEATKATSKNPERPNIIVILADDLGWGDVGFNGCTDIPTPHLDNLAKVGVVCNEGYASHSYCGPSRSGLLTGRYQQRFGCENNLGHDDGKRIGLPLSETLISNVLQDNGYTTCAIGKWHLGDNEKYWPINRGFDNWFGFTGGSRHYWGNLWEEKFTSWHRIFRDGKPEPLENLGYLTDDFTNAAVDYIEDYSKAEKPFFMYLAYNAPHAPVQATSEYLAMTDHIEDGKRATYAAMVAGMDAGIGKVIEKLKETGEFDNTLIFFYSDNGAMGNGASSAPYRGKKGMLFEGGIRVPFLVSWPNTLKGGQTYHEPVIAYDIFATAVEVAGIQYEKADILDGVNVLPFLKGENKDQLPHQELFWRYSDGMGYAVRKGDYKLVSEAVRGEIFLFNLKEDPLEHHNLASQNPAMIKELQGLYDEWNKDNVTNLWTDAHPEHVLEDKKKREWFVKRASNGEKKTQ